MEKTMKARVQHKHDIETNWLKATNFTPLASEIIVYDPDENYDYPRIKIGDGKTNINALPFVTKDYAKISDIPTKPQDIGALPDSTVIPTVPTKISAFENDKGYLTQHQSLDAYAKTADLGALATKDSLTASDVGALPDTTKIPSTLSDLTADPTHRTVTDTEKNTWNAKANASDIPTKVSDLTNDKGYITSYTETDPTVPSWAKAATKPSYTASEVGALPSTTKIPGALSELSEDATHRVVTDAEKETWNAKSNFSGKYNDLTNKPTIPSITGLASTTYVDNAVKNKVDKDGNKVLSTNDYTTAEKNKLANIAAGAEVNVNADWNATSGDAQILNKPTLGSMAAKSSVAKSDLASDVQSSLENADTALQPKDISDWAKQPSKPSYTANEVGALPNSTKIPNKTSDLTNDSGFITGYTETDPTVPAWAKKSTKPTYTANEVGADASGTASSLLSSHNVASNAHADIRSSISDLSLEVASIHDEVYIGSGTPTNGEKIQIDLNGSGSTLTIPDVLQTTGNSTEDTMSQKAITDALSNATVSDTQIATAVENYIAENPISGSNGKDGRGVVSTTRTSGTGAAGTTDTYTMTYTDNTTSTFTVYNGKNGTNGKSAYSYAQSGGYTGTESAFTTALANAANQSTETWTFTLEDGSTVSKTVVLL